MSEIILDMWLYTHHTSALLAKKSDNINKVSPILLPLQTLHIKSTTTHRSVYKYLDNYISTFISMKMNLISTLHVCRQV